ncbi:MAG: LamG-like jellyroll fold domain-containing protein, partial [Bacteroidota bacterium]
NGIKDLDSETPVVLDSVYNVTTVYNGSEMELYLNGELDAFAPFSGTLQTTTFDLTVGQALPNDNNYNFKGVVDDIRIFDYGLSVDEIAQLSSRVTSVEKDGISSIPYSYAVTAFPNPFNPSTVIRLSIPKSGHVTMKVVDLLGREVATLINEVMSAGVVTVRWNAVAMTSGVYFCVVKNSETMLIHKLILLK